MPTRYVAAPFWAPKVAATLDTLRDRKEASLLRANNLLLGHDARARALAENGVYAYAELRLRTYGRATGTLLKEVVDLRALAGARAEKLRSEGSLDPSAVAAEAAYLEVERLLSKAKH